MWTNRWMDRQTDEKRTNEHTEFHQFRMVIYLPVKFEFDWSNRFKVRVRKRKMWTDRQTDGQTDVGHINLIGGLVTRNPPNKNIKANICRYGKTVR